eukprot:303709-Amphidinium_carterae.1
MESAQTLRKRLLRCHATAVSTSAADHPPLAAETCPATPGSLQPSGIAAKAEQDHLFGRGTPAASRDFTTPSPCAPL